VLGFKRRQSRRLAGPLIALLAVALASCTARTLSDLVIGKQVEPPLNPTEFPTKYRSDIAEFMRTWLTNPTKVKDAFIGEPVIRPVAGLQHYITCVRYNPRDSKDRYEGNQSNFVVFLGGKLNQFLPGDPAMCSGLNYQRYPEIESMVP
jgi:hypothetical protein